MLLFKFSYVLNRFIVMGPTRHGCYRTMWIGSTTFPWEGKKLKYFPVGWSK